MPVDDDEATPCERGRMPVDDDEATPCERGRMPVDDDEATPRERGTMPVDDDEATPRERGTTPGEEEATPRERGTTPGGDEATPCERGTTPGGDEATPRERGRLPSLDGLRGLAALAVLAHHTLLASEPTLAGPYHEGPFPAGGSVGWLLTYTPLHILWAGPEFVVVFFVLSGFVLSLPTASGGGRPRALSYYPRRLLRLYLPVWAAVAFAGALHLAVSHASLPTASWWLDAHSEPLTLEALRQDAGLLSKYTGHWAVLDVLWSLRWEVLFSLALPLLLAVAVWVPAGRRTGRLGSSTPIDHSGPLNRTGRLGSSTPIDHSGPLNRIDHLGSSNPTDSALSTPTDPPTHMSRHSWSALVALLCCAALAWHGSSEYLLELPPFVLGMVLAFRLPQIERLAHRLRGRTPGSVSVKLLLAVACVCGLTADWWIPFGGDPTMEGFASVVVALGACLTVVAALVLAFFGAFLRSPPMAWTGRRSYSLYLVHSPIVVALAFAAGGRFSLGYLLAAFSLSLAAAAIFFALIEAPSHRFARGIGARSSRVRPARPARLFSARA
jgi:peptidoglycan/LPS O-acetylase OafA/YrhL